MARIRTIKPEFFRHRRLFMLEQESGLPVRVAYPALWTVADRDGRFRWEPFELKLDCLPYDDVDFSRVLDALVTRGFVVRYEVDGKEYGWIPGFAEHQVVNNRESASTLPAPPKNATKSTNTTTRQSRDIDAIVTRHDPAQGEGKGRERNKKESPQPPLPKSTPIAEPGQVDGSIIDEIRIAVWRQHGLTEDDIHAKLVTTSVEGIRHVRGWLERGMKPPEILEAIARAYDGAEARGEPIRRPWVYLDEVMRSAAEERKAADVEEFDRLAGPDDVQWRSRLRYWTKHKSWVDLWGDEPGQPGCQVPRHLLEELASASDRSPDAGDGK